MPPEWEIKARAHVCAWSNEAFVEGAVIYTLLYQDGERFDREDVSTEAWKKMKAPKTPFSFWKSRYEAEPPPSPEPLPKSTVEKLLRELIQADRDSDYASRYVLALMLERKKLLKQVDVRASGDEKILIYEHAKTGEVIFIRDPGLLLDQLDMVQKEVYSLLTSSPSKLPAEQ